MSEKRKAGRPKKTGLELQLELEESLELNEKINKVKEELAAQKKTLEAADRKLEALKNQKAELLSQRETFTESYRQFLDQCKATASQEAVTNEIAIAIIKEQSKKCQLDRVLSAKPGHGYTRPTFETKGDE